MIVVVSVGLLGGLTLGPGGVVAGGMAGTTGWRRWRAARQLRQGMSALAELAEAVRSLVGELRAGAHPAIAAENVAADAPAGCADAMRAIATAARFGGDIEHAVRDRPVLVEVGYAWGLAQRHGLPLADVLESVVRDLDQRARFARQVRARMAGPRASAMVLALLPLVGVALGEAMDARPLHVLGSTFAGQVMLVLGVALVCAGVAWSARLTHQAVLP
jgi:tight adherence protein B